MLVNDPQFAPVAPLQVLEELAKRNLRDGYGNYHLMLAHHVAEKAKWFNLMHLGAVAQQLYKYFTIIMDNSIVELGSAVDDKMIREAVEAVKVSNTTVIPVLPDVMGDGEETRRQALEACKRWSDSETRMPGHGMMLVAQGKDWEDFTKTVDFFFLDRYKYPTINWIGIPRWLENHGISRVKAVEYVLMVAPYINIHLFGFSDNIFADFQAARMDKQMIRGIDSAVPLRYSGSLSPMTTAEEIGKRDPDWFENGQLETAHLQNVVRVRSWLR